MGKNNNVFDIPTIPKKIAKEKLEKEEIEVNNIVEETNDLPTLDPIDNTNDDINTVNVDDTPQVPDIDETSQDTPVVSDETESVSLDVQEPVIPDANEDFSNTPVIDEVIPSTENNDSMNQTMVEEPVLDAEAPVPVIDEEVVSESPVSEEVPLNDSVLDDTPISETKEQTDIEPVIETPEIPADLDVNPVADSEPKQTEPVSNESDVETPQIDSIVNTDEQQNNGIATEQENVATTPTEETIQEVPVEQMVEVSPNTEQPIIEQPEVSAPTEEVEETNIPLADPTSDAPTEQLQDQSTNNELQQVTQTLDQPTTTENIIDVNTADISDNNLTQPIEETSTDTALASDEISPFANNEPIVAVENPVIQESSTPTIESVPQQVVSEAPIMETSPAVATPTAEVPVMNAGEPVVSEAAITSPTPAPVEEVPVTNLESSSELESMSLGSAEQTQPAPLPTGGIVIPDSLDQNYGVIGELDNPMGQQPLSTESTIAAPAPSPTPEVPVAQPVTPTVEVAPQPTIAAEPTVVEQPAMAQPVTETVQPAAPVSNEAAIEKADNPGKKSPLKAIIISVVAIFVVGFIVLGFMIFRFFSVDFVSEASNSIKQIANDYSTIISGIDAYKIINEADEWQYTATIKSNNNTADIEGGLSKDSNKFTIKSNMKLDDDTTANMSLIALNSSVFVRYVEDSYYYRFVQDEMIDLNNYISAIDLKPVLDSIADNINKNIKKDKFSSDLVHFKLINGKTKLVNKYSYKIPNQKAVEILNAFMKSIKNPVVKRFLINKGFDHVYGDVEVNAIVSLSGLEEIRISHNYKTLTLSTPKNGSFIIGYDKYIYNFNRNGNNLVVTVNNTKTSDKKDLNIKWDTSKKENSGLFNLTASVSDKAGKRDLTLDAEVKAVDKAILESPYNFEMADDPYIKDIFEIEYKSGMNSIDKFNIIKK